MTPDISEFSYGFALTRELIALAGTKLRAAPIFPSLIEEGRPGGGYDVQLDYPGFPLFIQFKRSDCLKGRLAKEAGPPLHLPLPYYRMRITERARSHQHKMLLALDAKSAHQVFYAAPLFHTAKELNQHYLATTVADRSCYVRPGQIGPLDGMPHYVSFTDRRFVVCSEPREIEGMDGHDFRAHLTARLREERKPFGEETLPATLRDAETILSDRQIETLMPDEQAKTRSGLDRNPLRRLADISLQYFNAQLFVVQDATREVG